MIEIGKPVAFAHRGGGFDALERGCIENTVEAFRYGVGLGYKYLETDVRAAADGTLYAWHGAGMDRVWAWRAVDERKIVSDGKRVANTLEEILEVLPRDTYLSVDIKHWRAVEPLVALVRRTNTAERLLIGSFSDRRTQKAVDDIHRAMGKKSACGMGMASFAKLLASSTFGKSRVPVSQQACWAPYTLVTPRLINAAHQSGVAVLAWTVNQPEDMERLLDIGVDGILTDRLVLLKEVMERRGLWV